MSIHGIGGSPEIPSNNFGDSTETLKEVCITLNNMFSNTSYINTQSSTQPLCDQLAELYGEPNPSASAIKALIDKALITPLTNAQNEINAIPKSNWTEDTGDVAWDVNRMLTIFGGVAATLASDVANKVSMEVFCKDLDPINEIFNLNSPLPEDSPYYELQTDLLPSNNPEDPPSEYWGLISYVYGEATGHW